MSIEDIMIIIRRVTDIQCVGGGGCLWYKGQQPAAAINCDVIISDSNLNVSSSITHSSLHPHLSIEQPYCAAYLVFLT